MVVCLASFARFVTQAFAAPLFLFAFMVSTPVAAADGPFMNGFDLGQRSVELRLVVAGGPPRGGIPSLTAPATEAASQASWLADDDRVVGVVINGQSRAYPLRLLNWHELVNDSLGDTPVLVSWCPLTASAVVFDRRVGGSELSFGVSGLLYQGNVLMYDRGGESLWSQLGGASVAGPSNRSTLTVMPSRVVRWGEWRRQYPDSSVLSLDTGHSRDYSMNPYATYETSDDLMFPVDMIDGRLRRKQKVLGLQLGGASRAWSLTDLAAAPDGAVPGGGLLDSVGGHRVKVIVDEYGARVLEGDRELASTVAYWFAWSAFNEQTSLWPLDAAPPETAIDSEGNRAGQVEILERRAYWTSPGLGFSMAGEATAEAGLYVIAGQLRNRSDDPIHHVVLRYELLDKQGRVRYRTDGYNRSAEGMLPIEGDPDPEGTLASVKPVAGGATDSFRMLVPAGDLPGFSDYRISVVAVR
ncbi:MAG: DUF3179 domain-containing protein [Proteobacteria bacterium]|nr:DUF3179 domain-containing protein [Pseudomonadota bacterium]